MILKIQRKVSQLEEFEIVFKQLYMIEILYLCQWLIFLDKWS
jgi:hypothetical protein